MLHTMNQTHMQERFKMYVPRFEAVEPWKKLPAWVTIPGAFEKNYLFRAETMSAVSRASTSSSLVGMRYTKTLERSVDSLTMLG